MNKEKILLILIFLLAGFLRFWQLDQVPPGVHADEADTGYSAYSIIKTGLTQYNDFNPLGFTEFNGGTHPPLYTYILIPLINFFDLNIIVERMPSGIFGTLAIPVFYFLVKFLSQSKTIALIAAFFLAVNPWFLHMSRQGLLEAVAVFFVLLGITLFLYAKDKKELYIFSAFAFGLSLHAYDAPKIFVPIFILMLTIFQWRSIIKLKKYLALFIATFGIFFFLMLKTVFFEGQINDYNKVSIFNTLQIEKTVDAERQFSKAPLSISKIFHNKGTVLLKRLQTSYFNIFSLNWFFVNGDGNFQQATVRHGEYHLFELPLFFIGLYIVFRKKRNIGLLLLGWLMLGAIPGAITSGNYPYRSVILLPVPIIFSAFGLVTLWNYLEIIKQIYLKSTIQLTLILIITGYVASFLFTYFFDYPLYASKWWFKERNEVLQYASSIQNKYDRVFVIGDVEWAVMHAFNDKIPPSIFQKAYKNQSKFKDAKVINIGKFTFIDINPSKITSPSTFFTNNSIIVTDAYSFPEEKELRFFRASDPLDKVYKVFEVKKKVIEH